MKLDTTKKYADVYGFTNVKYMQGGRYFDATGEEVKNPGESKPVGNIESLKQEQEQENIRVRGDDDRDPEPDATDANDVSQMEAFQARLSHYSGLHVATLRSEAQGVYDYAQENGIEISEPPMTGAGLKDRLAKWLAQSAVHHPV